MRGIAGKRVLISGGCGDIGRAVAARFLGEGARVVLADIVPEAEGREAAEALHPANALYTPCDVASKAADEQAVHFTIERLGGLDVAISNAGMVAGAPFLEAREEDWRRTLEVNLTGSFLFAQAAARAMRANPPDAGGRRGTLLFTGSWVQTMPWPEGVSYCASKGGQKMLMKVIAQELASEGITCNIVAPGIVYAGLSRQIYDRDEQYRRRAGQAVPLGRLSTTDEVAGAFLFLASDEAAYITGTSLIVDGGASLVRRDG
jgi:NAD(P)-dependent dehydrogenase (short-subunit alcohol dehydrogenase family)